MPLLDAGGGNNYYRPPDKKSQKPAQAPTPAVSAIMALLNRGTSATSALAPTAYPGIAPAPERVDITVPEMLARPTETSEKEAPKKTWDWVPDFTPKPDVVDPDDIDLMNTSSWQRDQALHTGFFYDGKNDERAAESAEDLARRKRAFAIGADIQGPVAQTPGHPQDIGVGETKRVGETKYEGYNNKQQAALDFNQALVTAVREDLQMGEKYDPTTDQQNRYDDLLTEVFGSTDAGSTHYAPETLTLLDQVGFKDKTSDLDDFLGLNAAITTSDVNHMTKDNQFAGDPLASLMGREVNPNDAVRQDRIDMARVLATNTLKLEKQLAHGVDLLQSMPATIRDERKEEIEGLGGNTVKPDYPLGYAKSDDLERSVFDLLSMDDPKATTGHSVDEILATYRTAVEKASRTPEEADHRYNQFMKFADHQSSMASRFQLPLGSDEDVQYLNPEKFRTKFGFGGG